MQILKKYFRCVCISWIKILDLDGVFNDDEKRSTRTDCIAYIFSSRSRETFHDRQTKVITQTWIFRISPDKSNSRFPIRNNLILATLLVRSLHYSHFISKNNTLVVFFLCFVFGFLSLATRDDKSLPSRVTSSELKHMDPIYLGLLSAENSLCKRNAKKIAAINKKTCSSKWLRVTSACVVPFSMGYVEKVCLGPMLLLVSLAEYFFFSFVFSILKLESQTPWMRIENKFASTQHNTHIDKPVQHMRLHTHKSFCIANRLSFFL